MIQAIDVVLYSLCVPGIIVFLHMWMERLPRPMRDRYIEHPDFLIECEELIEYEKQFGHKTAEFDLPSQFDFQTSPAICALRQRGYRVDYIHCHVYPRLLISWDDDTH